MEIFLLKIQLWFVKGTPLLRKEGHMQTIDRKNLKNAIDIGANFNLINVLPEDAFSKEHIAGSDNVSVDDADFNAKVVELVGDMNRPVVVYCASSDCTASMQAAKKLEKAGFKNVWAYEGGMKDWKDADYPVEGSA
jgi:rhodanese-related sulfurtransferase